MQAVTINRQTTIPPIHLPSIDMAPLLRFVDLTKSQTVKVVKRLYRISTLQSFMAVWTAPVD